ncbi:D-tyrosyl-tRNA(Tyr) deacylase [Coemansia thaxteri]|uniref:Multifunctional fusion protein n=1 Tax=Coemansia thaxteri TaxID=2663907 RepID=A0A9W8BJE8_9FUNG|nr:D-tyrosyl-tRNA(Tyr) deacylase [Coemansia thaxteri]
MAASSAQSGSPTVGPSSASSSVVDVASNGRRINKWFNLDLEDIPEVKEEVKPWRYAAVAAHSSQPAPPPMIIEVCLDVSNLSEGDELQLSDIFGRQWNVDLETGPSDASLESPPATSRGGRSHAARHRATSIVLESWRLDFSARAVPVPVPDLPRVYKQAIVFFRGLYSFASLLPSVSLIRHLQDSTDNLALTFSFRHDTVPRLGSIGLDVGLTGTEMFLEQHSFEPVPTPMGTFTMSVQYRRECLFTSLIPVRPQTLSDFASIGAIDNAYFTPTLSSRSGSHFSLLRQQVSSQQQQGQRQQQQHQSARSGFLEPLFAAGSERNSTTVPSINPFRARPLSLGDSSSLPSYIGDHLAHHRIPSRLSSEWSRANDPASSRGAIDQAAAANRITQRRISLGARAPGAEPLHAEGYSSRHSSARAHSFDPRAGSTTGRLSSSGGGATESGSMLHRSVMLRRFGDSLSPTEPQRQFDHATSRGSTSIERHLFGPTSPPKPSIVGSRVSSAGNAGQSSGRLAIGVAPFKSPSLSDSPGQSITSFVGLGDLPSSASIRKGEAASALSPQASFDASRQRGHTFSHEAMLLGLAQHSDTHQLITKLSGSPSSLGSNASGHSRGLSSSFGNRRASATVHRQHSILAKPQAEHLNSSDSAGLAGASTALQRRHTIVEGSSAPSRRPVDEDSAQEIDDFIRMVEARRPLGAYSRKDSAAQTTSRRRRGVLESDPRIPDSEHTAQADLGPGSTNVATKGVSLRMYQSILDQFSTMSHDMQSSVSVLQDKPQLPLVVHVPLASTPEDAGVGDMAADGLSSSPFRRQAMPNPLKGSDKPISSRPVSAVLAASTLDPPTRPVASTPEGERSLDTLRQAFGGLAIDSQSESTQLPARTGVHTASSSVVGLPASAPGILRPYIRNAAPGLDMKRERPLPQPVSIPRAQAGTPRRAAAKQPTLVAPADREQRQPQADSYDELSVDMRLNEARVRGKSQPLQHAAELSAPATPRMATPQPPGQGRAQLPATADLHQPAPRALPPLPTWNQRSVHPGMGGPSRRLSPDLGILSHRSDFISGSNQLGAMLSMADSTAFGNESPRSTPATPLLGAPLGGSGGGFAGHNMPRTETADATGRQSNRLRSNFPPLSFIVPRHRTETYAAAARPELADSGRQFSASNEPEEEDLMFQMEASILQKVLQASVVVGDRVVGEIGPGVCVLVGISREDTAEDIEYMARKVLGMRVFESSSGAGGNMWAKGVQDVGLEVLCVSQFTLYGKSTKGTKPDFHEAMKSEDSRRFFDTFVQRLGQLYSPDKIATGEFGAMMKVSLVNDGPVTLQLDSRKLVYTERDTTVSAAAAAKEHRRQGFGLKQTQAGKEEPPAIPVE